MNPQHQHDCDNCIFLGSHEKHDLYYCEDNPTVIARYGSYGDYISGLVLADSVPVLALAVIKALKAGHLTLETYTKATTAS